MVTMTDEQLLTVEQVAKRLQVTEWTVRNWLRQGRLRGLQPGGRKAGWRIRPSDLERFLAESEPRGERPERPEA